MAKLPTADDMATRGRKGKNNSPWKQGFKASGKTDAERAEQQAKHRSARIEALRLIDAMDKSK